jgi:hypothetical protein
MICDLKKGSIYFKGNEKFTINGLVSLHFIDFISWGVWDNSATQYEISLINYHPSCKPMDGL